MSPEIAHAVHLLRRGDLVAFPTETVYGLGADATNGAAIQKIFAAKGRPTTNPLIVHVATAAAARRWAAVWPAEAEALAAALWPGPITLVVPKSAEIVDAVTAGRPTVGLRVPAHPLALELLAAFDGPVAAPSANRSNHVSPTTAEHVRGDLGDAVDLILDGGACEVGIESTVLDLSGGVPTILRPGGVSREQIMALLDRRVVLGRNLTRKSQAAASPGQNPVHYAPSKPAFRFAADRGAPSNPRGGYLLIQTPNPQHRRTVVRMPNDPAGYAQRLYGALRELDRKKNLRVLYIEMPPEEPHWLAVRDRLVRATEPIEVLDRD